MPRFARQHCPGALVHVIGRFINHEFRLSTASERAALLDLVAPALRRTDWSLHAYALMSSHVHLAMLAGHAPAWQFLKPFHISVARHLNRAQGRFGPVFAERATTVVIPLERMAELVAYIHNNPVRAGAAVHPAASTWTSHRALLGIEPALPWLDVERTLSLMGFSATSEGRRGFAEFVCAHSRDSRDEQWSGGRQGMVRASVRAGLALPVELMSPELREKRLAFGVLHLGGSGVRPRWGGKLEEVIQQACEHTGVSIHELRSRSCRPRAVGARRLVVVTGAWLLRRPVNEVAAALGIAASSASRLLREVDGVMREAVQLAEEIWAQKAPEIGDLV